MDNSNEKEKDIIVEVRQLPSQDKNQKKQFDFLRFFELCLKFLWLIFSILVFYWFYPEIKYNILPNITSINIGGIGIEAKVKDNLEAISGQKVGGFDTYISPTQRDLIIERSKQLYKRLDNAKILWVDPNLYNNEDLRKILKNWGVSVDCAETDADAHTYLKNSFIDSNFYDVIITNYHHSEGRNALDFANSVRNEFYNIDIPIILFSFTYVDTGFLKRNGLPENFFAATNRYDYLFHFVFDALERGNAPYPANIQRYTFGADSLKLDD